MLLFELGQESVGAALGAFAEVLEVRPRLITVDAFRLAEMTAEAEVPVEVIVEVELVFKLELVLVEVFRVVLLLREEVVVVLWLEVLLLAVVVVVL